MPRITAAEMDRAGTRLTDDVADMGTAVGAATAEVGAGVPVL